MLSTKDPTSLSSGLEIAQAFSQPWNRIPRTILRPTTIPNVEKFNIKTAKGPNSRYCLEGNAIVLLKPIFERELKTIWRYFSIHHWSNRASLGIYVFFDISDALVESICEILVKECRGLKKFRFYADRCKLLTNEGLKKLGHFISCHLGNLTYLSLQFIVLQKVSNQGLRHLGSQIYAHSRNLRTLQLGFNCFANINDQGIAWLGSKLKFLESLESLSLSFWKLPKITNIGCGILASQIARDMVNLKQLSLDFSGCEEINDLGMNKLFGDKLSNSIANLKQLSIAFGNCLKITNAGLDLLVSDIVTSFTNLSCLEINFRGSRKITNQGITNAGSKIARSFSRLILLKLDFQKCDFANSQSLENIATEIVDHLKCLQQLELNFADCFYVSKESKTKVKEMLAAIPNITIY